jgi:CBS domain-containing protein
MLLSTLGSRTVVSAAPNATVVEVGRLMGERNVGSVLVVQRGQLLGIATDRDLVLRVLVKGLDPRTVTVEKVMSSPVVCASEEDGPHEAAAAMRENKVRRLPILAKGGKILGIVTFDDLVHHLGRTHAEMSDAIATFPVPYQGG